MFGNTKGKNTEGLSIPALGPGIYSGYSLNKVELTQTTKQDGSQGKDILVFHFDGPQGPHQYTEFDVDPTDAKAESKRDNMSVRITHIMTKFIPKDQADAIGGADFKSYAANVVAALNPAITSQVKTLEIKVLGNVYNGKATSNFPGYPPFIAKVGAPDYKPLSFSDRERKANQEYNNFLSATPDNDASASSPATSSTTASGAPVDNDF